MGPFIPVTALAAVTTTIQFPHLHLPRPPHLHRALSVTSYPPTTTTMAALAPPVAAGLMGLSSSSSEINPEMELGRKGTRRTSHRALIIRTGRGSRLLLRRRRGSIRATKVRRRRVRIINPPAGTGVRIKAIRTTIVNCRAS